MGVCELKAKRTRQCYRIALLVSPVGQSSKTSRVRFTVISHTPCVLAFITHILCMNGIEMAVVWLILYILWVTHVKFVICFIALMNRGETCHLKTRDLVTVWRTMLLLYCYHFDYMPQHYDVTQFEYVLWRQTVHEWVMNIHYQTWIAQGRFTNIILTPSKQWGVSDNVIDCLCRCKCHVTMSAKNITNSIKWIVKNM